MEIYRLFLQIERVSFSHFWRLFSNPQSDYWPWNDGLYRKLYRCEMLGARWLSVRVLNSRSRGCGFEPHVRHCVVCLSKIFRVYIHNTSWTRCNCGLPIFSTTLFETFHTLCQRRTNTANTLTGTATKIAYPLYNHLVLRQKVLAPLIVPLAIHSTHHLQTDQVKQPLLDRVRTH